MKAAIAYMILSLNLLFISVLSYGFETPLPPQVGPTFKKFVQNMGGNLNFNPDLFSPAYNKGAPRNSVALVPFGRSLERKFSDDLLPRALISFGVTDNLEVNTPVNGYVLIGYTAYNNQLQIIASNNTGRGNGGYNDFILVDDYAEGKTARVSYPNGGLCLACHQGGNLIFPEASWEEVSREHSLYFRQRVDNKIINTIAQYETQVFMYDRVIRTMSEEFSMKQQLKNVCKGELECRLSILKIALGLDTNIKKVLSYFRTQKNRAATYMPSNEISERTANVDNVQHVYKFPFTAGEDPLFPRRAGQFEFSLSQATEEQTLDVITRFGVIENSLGRNARVTEDYLKSAFAADLVLHKWPVLRTDLNTSIGQFMSGEKLERAVSEQILAPLKDPKQIFFRYCYMCHHPGGAVAALDVNNLKGFVGSANHGRTPKTLIKMNLMPPEGALQMSAGEKKILLDYIDK